MIECRAVTARAGDFTLRDVSFSVPAGAHAVLTGPTASGKTTLLDAIAGLTPVLHGAVLLDGHDVTRARPEARGVGVVPQHGYLFPHLDVHANVAYGATDVTRASALLQRFGIASLAARSVRSLSGGERQLVALCRALAACPRVLLLDEPFSALDDARRHEAAAELDRLHHADGFTILHATHHVSEAAARATIRLEMRDGTVRTRD